MWHQNCHLFCFVFKAKGKTCACALLEIVKRGGEKTENSKDKSIIKPPKLPITCVDHF